MHSFVSVLIHCVWTTKKREPWLTPDLTKDLWPYLGGIARKNNYTALAVGGVSDHVHLLISLPSNVSTAKAIQLIKGNSSKWIHDTRRNCRSFQWQEGYGAFSIGVSGIDETAAYIRNQRAHHRQRTFDEEFRAMLERHGFDFHPTMLD